MKRLSEGKITILMLVSVILASALIRMCRGKEDSYSQEEVDRAVVFGSQAERKISADQGKVYVCTEHFSLSYHYWNDCYRLEKCTPNYQYDAMPEELARKRGFKLCGRCWKEKRYLDGILRDKKLECNSAYIELQYVLFCDAI